MREPSRKPQFKPVHPLLGHLGYQLRRSAILMQADLTRRLAVLGLNMIEMSTLLIVEANPAIAPAQIGRMINVARANMAPVTTGLVNRKLIETKPVDGRSIGLHLSPEGRDMVASIHHLISENEAVLMKRIPLDERARLIEQISHIWSDDE